MNRLSIGLIVILRLLTAAAHSQQPNAALDKLFASAQHKATVEGNLRGAVEDYKRIVAGAGKDRSVAARALLLMAEAYQKLGDAEAQKTYQQIVRDFPEQKDAVDLARARLQPTRGSNAGTTQRDVPALNVDGSVSADGRYAAYMNWNNGNIVVRDLQTGTSREVARRQDLGEVGSPTISPDGKTVAFESSNGCIERRPLASANGVLCLLPTDTELGAANTLLERADVRRIEPMHWSPDGRSIAAMLLREDGTAQVGIVRVADGRLTALQSTDWRGATRIFFSPEGRYVAFDLPIDDVSDRREIRTVAVDGSRGVTAVQGSSQNIVMGWTPDGDHLLFASDRTGTMALWAQRVTNAKPDGTPRLVHAGLGGALSLGVTKSGAMYFAVPQCCRDVEIASIDLAAGKQTSSTRPSFVHDGRNMMPEWSRDGRFLAHVRQRGLSSRERPTIVGIRDSETGVVRELHPKLSYINGLNWSPDNTTLITFATDLRGRSGVFTIDARTGAVGFVVDGGYPQYSPNGRHLFYVKPGEGPGPKAIVERDLTSGNERTIVSGELIRFGVSPDGRSLAATWGGLDTGNAREVVVIRVDSGEVRPILRAQRDDRIPTYNRLPWTPDGQAVLMRNRPSPTGGELWLVPTTGAPARLLDVDVKGWAISAAGVLSLHPDGSQLAGTRLGREDTGSEVKVLENFLPALRK